MGLLAFVNVAAVAQSVGVGIPGPNVNIIGPVLDPLDPLQIPDKTFKQQNEPSCAVQPSNPQNVFCAYNDYRGVDIPTIGDAWIGASMSRNGGDTWTSRLVPGFPNSPGSLNEGYAADATVAAVPGMALLGFIAAGRDSASPGGMFLQLWPEENKEDGAPWSYLVTQKIFGGTSGQFVDKPAMLVTLSGGTPVPTTLPGGATRRLAPAVIHVAYANFSGNDVNDSASIYYIRSTDYGKTWSNKNKLSESIALNQGVALAAKDDTVLAVWRQFDKNNNQADSFAYAVSTNGGNSWSKPATVPLPASQICTFDQPSQLPEANYAFRTKALPSLVSDGNRFYLIWARRTVDENGFASCTRGRSRIAYLTTNGTSWDTDIRLVDEQPGDLLSHQFMPAAFAAGGVVEVSWYDTRDDQFYKDPSLPNSYNPYVVDAASGGAVNRRHTADIYHAQITGGTASSPGSPLGSVKVSQYAVGNGGGDFPVTAQDDGQQLEFNYVNGRLFKQATKPFLGDYNAVAAPAFRLNQGGAWVANQGALGSDPGPKDPTFQAFWADNRDVRSNVYTQTACAAGAAPGSPGCPGSSSYTPANADEPKFLGETGSNSTGQCVRDFNVTYPFETPPGYCLPNEDAAVCRARYVDEYETYLAGLKWPSPSGSEESLKALSRNQNVYSSVIKPGVVFGTASATKPTDIQRAFVVYVRNDKSGTDAQAFRLDVSPYPVSTGGTASFTQSGTPLTSLTVQVPAGSTAARTVFVTSATQALVSVYEGTQLLSSVVLNGNPSAAALSNPDCSGKSCDGTSVVAYEGHNPDLVAQAYTVEFPSYRNPSLRNPSLRNSVYESPSLRNQTVEFPSLRNPSLRNSPLTDAAAQGQTYTDFVYDVANMGNTTSAYTLKPLVTGPQTTDGKPLATDGTALNTELIVSRVYQEQTAQNCETVTIGRQQVVADIGNPNVSVAPTGDQDGNPATPPNPATDQQGYDPLADPGLAADARHGTFFVEPGGKAQVTLRVWGIDLNENPEFRNRVWMKVYAQAKNTGGGQGVAFDVTCGTGNDTCTQPDIAPVFTPSPDPGFLLNSPQPANVLYIEANAKGGWKPPASFAPPAVYSAFPVNVICVDRATGIDVTKLTSPIPVGPAAVICTATDSAGRVSQPVEYDFVVLDDVAPKVTLHLPSGLDGIEATGPDGEVVTFEATAFDDVNGPVPATCVPSSGSRFLVGTTAVTCSAKDSPPIPVPGSNPPRDTNNQEGTATFSVVVNDSTAPIVTVPADITVEATSTAGATADFIATATDLVSGAITPTCTPASGSTFAIGLTTVTCTATDGARNTGSASFKVTVKDTTPPPFTYLGNPVSASNPLPSITKEAAGPTGAYVTYSLPDATDSASPPVNVVCTPASGALFPLGNTTVNCTATDARGNSATASFTVTVSDTTAPVLTLPADVVAEATGSSGANVPFTPTAADLVDGSVTPVCAPVSGSLFALGTATVSCSATDRTGNRATSTFKVTVRDTTKPIVTAPASVVAEATGPSGAAVSYPAATASDLVGGTLAAPCLPASGSTFALGTTTVACAATDANGNTGSATFTVTVRDTTPPVVTAPANVVAEATGPTGAAVTYPAATAIDLVSGSITPTCTPASGGTFAIGTTTVNCTATDARGNVGSKTFTVTVRDTTPPVVTVPAPMTATTSGTTAAITYSVTAKDLVSGSITPTCSATSTATPAPSNVSATGGTFPVGVSTVICTAKDAATPTANTGTASFTVTVTKLAYAGLDGVYANGTKSINSSVPLDFGFTNSSNVRVDSALAQPLVTVFRSDKASCSPGDIATATKVASYPGASDYRYSTSGFNWQFNWKTTGLTVGCYIISVYSGQTGKTYPSKYTVKLTK